jgi:hypothetical protein
VSMQTGLWTPDVIAPISRDQGLQSASIRVLGLRLSIRQIGLLLLPFWNQGGPVSVYKQLLIELCVVDFFSLEEAIYTGNQRGSTPSLVSEWSTATPTHPGAAYLLQHRNDLSPSLNSWRNTVRNKICAHMDSEIAAADLDVSRWPMTINDFNTQLQLLCELFGKAARQDVRTQPFTKPVFSVGTASICHNRDVPRWSET